MPVRKLPRDHESLDAIRLYDSLRSHADADTALHDGARLEEFLGRIRESITGSLGNPSRLHGIHEEAMFRAAVVAIGEFQLITEEDSGDVYFDDTIGGVQPPDYRVVDRDGHQLLVEVKGVPPQQATRSFAMRAVDVESRLRYAEMTGAPLFFALYWPGWNLWTLVPESALERNGAKREIDLSGALLANQMVRLGDATIGTTPPLTLSIELDAEEKPIRPGTVNAVITDTRMTAANSLLEDPLESNIAWTLIQYGTWTIEEEQTLSNGGGEVRIDFVAQPPIQEAQELARRQGFISIGTLSSIYSAMFLEATLTVDGVVRHLAHEPVPGMTGALIPRDYWERPDRRLRIWRLEAHPADTEARAQT